MYHQLVVNPLEDSLENQFNFSRKRSNYYDSVSDHCSHHDQKEAWGRETTTLENVASKRGLLITSSVQILMHPLINELRGLLINQGSKSCGGGFVPFERFFLTLDASGFRQVSYEMFQGILYELFPGFYNESKIKEVFRCLCKNESIAFDDLFSTLRGTLPRHRRQLVEEAFRSFATKDIDSSELVGRFDAGQHPDVIGGHMSLKEALQEFVNSFTLHSSTSKATFDDFLGFYTSVSACIFDDGYFEQLLTCCWSLSQQAQRDGRRTNCYALRYPWREPGAYSISNVSSYYNYNDRRTQTEWKSESNVILLSNLYHGHKLQQRESYEPEEWLNPEDTHTEIVAGNSSIDEQNSKNNRRAYRVNMTRLRPYKILPEQFSPTLSPYNQNKTHVNASTGSRGDRDREDKQVIVGSIPTTELRITATSSSAPPKVKTFAEAPNPFAPGGEYDVTISQTSVGEAKSIPSFSAALPASPTATPMAAFLSFPASNPTEVNPDWLTNGWTSSIKLDGFDHVTSDTSSLQSPSSQQQSFNQTKNEGHSIIPPSPDLSSSSSFIGPNRWKSSLRVDSEMKTEDLDRSLDDSRSLQVTTEGESNIAYIVKPSNTRQTKSRVAPGAATSSSSSPPPSSRLTKLEVKYVEKIAQDPTALLGQSKRVLVVDDSSTIRMITVKDLESKGHQVDQAENGEAAVAMIKKNRYDIVLMDLQMPIMDGISATKAIREYEMTNSEVYTQPIIGITSFNDDQAIRRIGIKAGMQEVLPKPFTIEMLSNVLGDLTRSVKDIQEQLSSPERQQQNEIISSVHSVQASFNPINFLSVPIPSQDDRQHPPIELDLNTYKSRIKVEPDLISKKQNPFGPGGAFAAPIEQDMPFSFNRKQSNTFGGGVLGITSSTGTNTFGGGVLGVSSAAGPASSLSGGEYKPLYFPTNSQVAVSETPSFMGAFKSVIDVAGSSNTATVMLTSQNELTTPVIKARSLVGRSLYILVVDDSDAIRRMTVKALENENHRVDSASDGEKAIVMIKKNKYDLILMDVQMPNVDGLVATRFIRQYQISQAKDFSPRIIGVSGFSDEKARVDALESGMDDFLAKPFSISDMNSLNKLLDNRIIEDVVDDNVNSSFEFTSQKVNTARDRMLPEEKKLQGPTSEQPKLRTEENILSSSLNAQKISTISAQPFEAPDNTFPQQQEKQEQQQDKEEQAVSIATTAQKNIAKLIVTSNPNPKPASCCIIC